MITTGPVSDRRCCSCYDIPTYLVIYGCLEGHLGENFYCTPCAARLLRMLSKLTGENLVTCMYGHAIAECVYSSLDYGLGFCNFYDAFTGTAVSR